ncbi:MAG: nitrogen fixation protein FixH [Cytophagales bacterium]|nr:nitrogen fixation protein FixH [Rhizobacter sp.]
MSMNPAKKELKDPNPPWWRVGMVWLVLAGPAIVVVASFATLRLALVHGDPVINEPPAQSERDTSLAPAVKARNHAATPKP